jgi:hypothetical protein
MWVHDTERGSVGVGGQVPKPLLAARQKTCLTTRSVPKERALRSLEGPTDLKPWPEGERDGRRGRTHPPMGGPAPRRGARDLCIPSMGLWPERPELPVFTPRSLA